MAHPVGPGRPSSLHILGLAELSLLHHRAHLTSGHHPRRFGRGNLVGGRRDGGGSGGLLSRPPARPGDGSPGPGLCGHTEDHAGWYQVGEPFERNRRLLIELVARPLEDGVVLFDDGRRRPAPLASRCSMDVCLSHVDAGGWVLRFPPRRPREGASLPPAWRFTARDPGCRRVDAPGRRCRRPPGRNLGPLIGGRRDRGGSGRCFSLQLDHCPCLCPRRAHRRDGGRPDWPCDRRRGSPRGSPRRLPHGLDDPLDWDCSLTLPRHVLGALGRRAGDGPAVPAVPRVGLCIRKIAERRESDGSARIRRYFIPEHP